MPLLSVIIPAYNEEAMLPRTIPVLTGLFSGQSFSYELIFVDDGSSDHTWETICAFAKDESVVHGVHFSRNFGKDAAICAGLAHANGDCCVVMDCDLQHPPQVILEMYRLWEQGYEVVEGVKRSRGKEALWHKASAGMFYKIMSFASGIDMRSASDYKLLDRKAVKSLLAMPERKGFFRAQSAWIGFRTASVSFDVQQRELGTSKWSARALVRYALTNILSYSTLPMQIVTFAGVFVFLIGVILSIQTLIRYFTGNSVEGFTTVILLLLFLGSVIMISLGIIGYYIAQIYQEVQRRPRYIISEII